MSGPWIALAVGLMLIGTIVFASFALVDILSSRDLRMDWQFNILAVLMLASPWLLASWLACYRVWVTPTHLVVREWWRTRAVRWADVQTVVHRTRSSGQGSLPSRVLVRMGSGASGVCVHVTHSLFANGDALAGAIAWNARLGNPRVRLGPSMEYYLDRLLANPRVRGLGALPPKSPSAFEVPGLVREGDLRLHPSRLAASLWWVLAVVGVVAVVHGVVSIAAWLAHDALPTPPAFLLAVAEFSLGPLSGVLGLYLLTTRVMLTPGSLTIRAWGSAKRSVPWDLVRVPRVFEQGALWCYAPLPRGAGSAVAMLFHGSGVVFAPEGYRDMGLFWEIVNERQPEGVAHGSRPGPSRA